MRVLFTAHGSFGHVLPMAGIARALQGAGHEVRFATGEAMSQVLSSLGLTAIPAGMSDDALVAETRRRWPETERQPPADWAPRMFTDIAASNMLADLAPVIASFAPELLIREEGEHAGPIAAAAAGIPWLTHGWGSPLPARAALEELAERIEPLWRTSGLVPPSVEDLFGACLLDPCPRSLYDKHGPPFPTTAIRATPLISTDRRPPPRAAGQPLAYVGSGTVALYRDPSELIEIVVEALLSSGFCVVITTSHAELTARLIALDPERVHVERWVSLPDLFPHCRLVVSHAGAGTVLAALAAGVPLLLLPRGAPSQARMSQACQSRGAARAITSEPITAPDIDEALRSLIAEDRFRTAARELAREIAATPGPDEIVPLLQTLASHSAAQLRP